MSHLSWIKLISYVTLLQTLLISKSTARVFESTDHMIDMDLVLDFSDDDDGITTLKVTLKTPNNNVWFGVSINADKMSSNTYGVIYNPNTTLLQDAHLNSYNPTTLLPSQWTLQNHREMNGQTIIEMTRPNQIPNAPEYIDFNTLKNDHLVEAIWAHGTGTQFISHGRKNRAAGALTVAATARPTFAPVTRVPTTSPTTSSPTTTPTKSPSKPPTPWPTPYPSPLPTTEDPTAHPTDLTQTPSYQTPNPTRYPTSKPTDFPTQDPTKYPTQEPTDFPTDNPTQFPSLSPTEFPTYNPSTTPTRDPTQEPTDFPTENPTEFPTYNPSTSPTRDPTHEPTDFPTENPSEFPSLSPTEFPTYNPSPSPTREPTSEPSDFPTDNPSSANPSASPTPEPTKNPLQPRTPKPIPSPTLKPTPFPTNKPTAEPTFLEDEPCVCEDDIKSINLKYIGQSKAVSSIRIYSVLTRRSTQTLCNFQNVEKNEIITCDISEGDNPETVYFKITHYNKRRLGSGSGSGSGSDSSSDSDSGSSNEIQPQTPRTCHGYFDTSCDRDIVGDVCPKCADLRVIGWTDTKGKFCDEQSTDNVLLNEEEMDLHKKETSVFESEILQYGLVGMGVLVVLCMVFMCVKCGKKVNGMYYGRHRAQSDGIDGVSMIGSPYGGQNEACVNVRRPTLSMSCDFVVTMDEDDFVPDTFTKPNNAVLG